MAYEVTATRRRPQKFSDLVGQEFVAETLKNSINSGKIAHAYLFAGPRGCGKTSTARILAKALNCEHGPSDNPCGTCPNCQEITKGSSLDVIEIDGASNTSVENIRQIKDEVLFPPTNSRYKIYIIDEVHMLSTSAFNALLKTIEEPPPYVVFIFATTELQKVPATIKSRCQQFNFRLVAIDKVKDCLKDACNELNIQADDEALFWIARESTGSMRDAYTLFDQVVAFSDGYITYEKIRDKLGLVGIDRLNTIFEACSENKTETVINLLDEFLQNGVSIDQLITNSADYLRSLLFIKNGVKKESLLGNSPERYSAKVLSLWNPLQIERALSLFLQLYRDIRYSLSPRYELELAFSRLCWIGQYVSNMEVKKAIDQAQNLLLSGTAQGSAATGNAYSSAAAAPVASAASSVSSAPVSAAFTQNKAPLPENPPETLEQAPVYNQGSSAPKSGLPHFSSSAFARGEEIERNETSGEQHPFPDGGSLPPEQPVNESVAGGQVEQKPDEEAVVAAVKKSEIDEKLKINVSLNVENTETVQKSEFVVQKSSSYTENPDDEEWTNTDTPPEEDFYVESDDETALRAEQTYEDSTNENLYTNPQNQAATEAENGLEIVTKDGRKLTQTQLKGSVIANLSVSDSFAATAIEKTGSWKYENDKITTTVTTAYDLSLLQKKVPVVKNVIAGILGRNLEFEIKLDETQNHKSEEKKEVPQQVKVLVETFKGTLITGA